MLRPGGEGVLLKRIAHLKPVDLSLCSVAAVATFMSFPTELAPELTFWPLIWFSHVPLLFLLRTKSPRGAFGWGLFCGFLINTGGYYWMASMLKTFGALPWPIAVMIMLLHSLQLGLIWGVWAWLVNRISNTTSVPVEWSVPIVMVAVEFVMPRIFPAYMGNSQYLFPPIMQVVDIFGIGAVTFLIYRVNAVLYLWLRALLESRSKPMKATYLTVLMLASTLVYGFFRMAHFDEQMHKAKRLKVGVAEGDVGIFQVESAERQRDHLLIQQRLSQELANEGADLIIWPESAYRARPLERHASSFPRSTAPLAKSWRSDRGTAVKDRHAPQRGFDVPLLFGTTSIAPSDGPRWQGDGPYIPRNTAFLLDRKGRVSGAYDKVYLLAFGEYVPFIEWMPWFYKYIPAAGRLEPGDKVEVLSTEFPDVGEVRIGVLICYEGILPSFARNLSGKGAHFIANLTNDDWFGKTAERYLHFALTVPRAIEHRTAFVRSTLTGVSAFVDVNGRVVKATSMYEPERIMWSVPLLTNETIYQRIGDFFPWVAVALTLMWYLWGRIRRRAV